MQATQHITKFQKITLGISGVTALVIGGFIALAPHAFYAGYGLEIGRDPSHLSDLRAPATNLAALGLVMLAGLMRVGMMPVSVVAAFTVFLAFPAGRLISLFVDGVPSGALLGALAGELVIAGLLVLAFGRRRASIAIDPVGQGLSPNSSH